MSLTVKQRNILDFLDAYTAENGYAPSFQEIAAHFNYNSLATVHEHLKNLQKKNYIKRNFNESRAIEILPSEVLPRSVTLPLKGLVAAGMPIEMTTHGETVAVPEDFIRRGSNHYVLKVRGDSMIEDHIQDGDFVVVQERQGADNGEMVIAMLDDSSATVKRYYRERDGRIRLQPSNDTMAPIYLHENQMRVQGIVVGVMRRY
ncbi:MAG: transcriptional repressor LexA [Gemmatimonadetes bacterium]|jgi:repressor LexA|nr:transcriptional repressor LexA [Gemmatimonadota bacterium]